MRPFKSYIKGLEDGLQGIGFLYGGSKRHVRAYEAGVKRGKAWRKHIEEGKFGWPDASAPDSEEAK